MIRATLAQAAQFILDKNHLIRPAGNLNDLVKTLAGLPGQPRVTSVLSARARLQAFKPDELSAALFQDRTLINNILMRSIFYIVRTDDYLSLYAATARQRRQALNSEFRLWGIENIEIAQVGEAILAVLGEGPSRAQSIAERLAPTLGRELTQTSRGGRVSTTSNVELALRWLASRGIIVAGQEGPPWLGGEPGDEVGTPDNLVYALISHWYPFLDLSQTPDESTAQMSLVRAYLAVFGPAAEADVSFWTGLSKSETARAVNALSAETTLALVEGIPGMMLLLKSQADALRDIRPAVEPVLNILPANDPFTVAHRASRSRYFSDQTLQRQVFSSSGSAKPTILLNGQIIGVWQVSTGTATSSRWQLLTEVDDSLEARVQADIERVDLFLRSTR